MADIEIIKDSVDEYLKAVDAAKQRDLFDKENPRWADFFSDRR